MQLTGKQIGQVSDALLAAFDKAELIQMVRVELEEVLEHHVADGDDLTTIVSELVRWAKRRGRIEDLIRGAYKTNPGNPELQQLWTDSRAWSTNKGNVPSLGLLEPSIDKVVVQAPCDRVQSAEKLHPDIADSLYLPELDDRDISIMSRKQADEFDDRLRSAVPRSQQKGYYQAQNVIEINRVLQRLADESESYGLFWTRGEEKEPAAPFQQLSENVWLIGWLECDVKDLWVYRHHRSVRQYVVLHLKAMTPFFDEDSPATEPEDPDEPWEVEAAYSYSCDKYFTLAEFFNGYAEIEGEVVEMPEPHRRVRNLRDDFLFLAPSMGLYVGGGIEQEDQVASVRRTLLKVGQIQEDALRPLEKLQLFWWMID